MYPKKVYLIDTIAFLYIKMLLNFSRLYLKEISNLHDSILVIKIYRMI